MIKNLCQIFIRTTSCNPQFVCCHLAVQQMDISDSVQQNLGFPLFPVLWHLRSKLNPFTFVVWHHSLLLMNGFNKTDAAVFSCRICFLRAFLFISLILQIPWFTLPSCLFQFPVISEKKKAKKKKYDNSGYVVIDNFQVRIFMTQGDFFLTIMLLRLCCH